MKVGIVTLTRNPNHGNILQNLALSRTLNKLGLDCETIINAKGSTLFPVNTLKRTIKLFVKSSARKQERHRKNFVRYARKYISYSPYIYNGKNLSYCESDYDFFLVGSDQVWNPYFGFATEFEFLEFAPQEKRYSYAASMAVTTIPEQKKESIIRLLKEMQKISVRETSSVDLINSLTNGNVYPEVHIDPTMLIDANEWHLYEEKPKTLKENGNFVFVYLLGCETVDDQKIINSIAGEEKVVRLIDSPKDSSYYWNPGNFLWMIHHAKCVITDSFHGTVFSILFEKDFIVLERKDKYADQSDRLKTLLSKFDLLSHMYNGTVECCFNNKKSVSAKLMQEREKSTEYFRDIISEVDNKNFITRSL